MFCLVDFDIGGPFLSRAFCWILMSIIVDIESDHSISMIDNDTNSISKSKFHHQICALYRVLNKP